MNDLTMTVQSTLDTFVLIKSKQITYEKNITYYTVLSVNEYTPFEK